MDKWLSIDPYDIADDRIIKVYIVLQGKLESPRAFAMNLAVVAKFLDLS